HRMTARALLSPAFALSLLACRTSVDPSPPDDPPPTSDVAIGRNQDPAQMLASLSDRFLREFFATAPVSATAYGEHGHDHRWPDLSGVGAQAQRDWRIELLDELAAIPRDQLDADGRLELDT